MIDLALCIFRVPPDFLKLFLVSRLNTLDLLSSVIRDIFPAYDFLTPCGVMFKLC